MKKLLSVSNILACANFVLALIFIILYAANVGSAGYFQGSKVGNFVLLVILAMVADLIVIGASVLKLNGALGKVVNILVSACKIVAPAMLILAVMLLVSYRVEGFGFIYFSNVDVAKEVQTPANLASAGLAITAIVFGTIAGVEGIVAAFFAPKEQQPVQE